MTITDGTLAIETAKVFRPLTAPSRYKGAWGGRGSGKSHFFAGLMVEEAVRCPGEVGEGLRAVCLREVQEDLRDSAKALLEAKIGAYGLGRLFRSYLDRIETPGGGVIVFQGLKDHTAESIKSLEGFRVAWVEEAQVVTRRSLAILRPTIRAPGSQLWFSWNPRRPSDPVDAMLRGDEPPTNSVVIKANWRDNPWLTPELEEERQNTLRSDPDQYDHIWEGGYQVIAEGAYYARQLADMRGEGRLGRVAADPLMTYRAFWDIGGTGAKSDAAAIWVVQFVGREIRVLDYYEAQGQPLAAHIGWLRDRGYEKALCVLPHDGATYDRVHAVSYEGALRSAGFAVQVVPNQGRGAASMRIEAARRLFPSVWVHEETTRPGMLALGAYHPRVDSKREVDLGPEHDWASHAADAWGLMAVAYEAPREKPKRVERPMRAGSWMAA